MAEVEDPFGCEPQRQQAAASSQSTSQQLSCAFNQDGGCLAIGTTTGFSIHNLHPQYGLSVQRQLQGGIAQVELLFRCNLMALVGGGLSPHAPPHRVLIWDDHIPKEAGELSFRQVVLRVRLRKDAIAVALRDRVYVYHLADLSLRDKIYTADNPHGLLCLSTQIQDMVLACPSVTTGHVRVELYGLRKTVLMEAHETDLRGLALSADGTKLATASVKGTVIRVWDVATSTCLQECRRGFERTTITCLAWSWDCHWLSCASDHGTVHVFEMENAVNGATNGETNNNKKQETSSASSLTRMLFSSVRKSVEGDAKKSIAQIRGIPHPQACAFVADAPNLIAVAGWDADGNGVLLLTEFSANAQQEPRRVGYHVLCKSAVQQETEEARRRRRLRGWTPEIPQTPEGGRLYVGDRLEILEKGMEQIHFEEPKDGDDDEFVSVTAVRNTEETTLAVERENKKSESATNNDDDGTKLENTLRREGKAQGDVDSSDTTDELQNSSNLANSGTVGDSVRTEPLDDDAGGMSS